MTASSGCLRTTTKRSVSATTSSTSGATCVLSTAKVVGSERTFSYSSSESMTVSVQAASPHSQRKPDCSGAGPSGGTSWIRSFTSRKRASFRTMRSSRSPIFLDNIDISLVGDDALTVHEGMADGDREPVRLLPERAKSLGRELDRAPAIGVQALAEKRNRPLATNPVADRAEESLVGTAEDLLVLSFELGIRAHRLPRTPIPAS